MQNLLLRTCPRIFVLSSQSWGQTTQESMHFNNYEKHLEICKQCSYNMPINSSGAELKFKLDSICSNSMTHCTDSHKSGSTFLKSMQSLGCSQTPHFRKLFLRTPKSEIWYNVSLCESGSGLNIEVSSQNLNDQFLKRIVIA